MGEFFLDGERIRVTFDDGQWVEIKEELTQADQDYILDHLAKGETAGKDTRFVLSLGRMAMLERSVVAWSFPAPVTADNISRLRLRYRQKVLAEVNRLNELAGEWTRKNESTASTSPSTALS